MGAMSAAEQDAKWMTEAIQEARKGRPSPNPHVGALLVKDGEIIAVGHHDQAGQAHAEGAAIESAGERARGATLYVTLEPCNHHGRTAPCVDAILAAGVTRVVVGARDPNPHVEGGGIERLLAAGVEVDQSVMADEAARLIKPWAKFITTGLPFVALKLALSVDGRIATRTGASRWITGKTARAKVHALRARHDAVAVGIGTVLADDPTLTVRDAPGTHPVRIVFDSKLRLPLSSKLISTLDEAALVVVTTVDAPVDGASALEDRGITVLRAESTTEGRVDLLTALQELASVNVVSLMVEGGAELAGSFLAARLADQLHAFIAPSLLGPRGRPGAVDWAGPATPSEAPRLSKPVWELCGEDAYLHGEILYPDEQDQ